VFTTEQMRQTGGGRRDDPDTVTRRYVVGADGLDTIPDRFAAILSRHNLEHHSTRAAPPAGQAPP